LAKSKRKTTALLTGITPEAEREFQHVREIASKYSVELFKIPGVISVGVGAKRKKHERDPSSLVVVVTVRKKRTGTSERSRLKKLDEMIPTSLDGVPTDVVDEFPSQHLSAVAPRGDSFSPIVGGIVTQSSSLIGFVGTLGGCLYIKKHPGGVIEANGFGGVGVAMSNSHVWAGPEVSTRGDTRVYQSTRRDGEDIGSVIVNKPGQDTALCLLGDDSDGTIINDIEFSTEVFGLGFSPTGFGIPRPGQTVVKSGAFTAVTRGVVDGFATMSTGRVYWKVLSSSGFSFEGDSGSFVINESNQTMVGLMWGGDNGPMSAFENAENIVRVCPYLTFEAP